MSETTPTAKRRFWQIHLSTAVVLMFFGAAILWLNLQPSRRSNPYIMRLSSVSIGCPDDVYTEYYDQYGSERSSTEVDKIGIAKNVGFWLGLSFVAAILLEHCARKREGAAPLHRLSFFVAALVAVICITLNVPATAEKLYVVHGWPRPAIDSGAASNRYQYNADVKKFGGVYFSVKYLIFDTGILILITSSAFLFTEFLIRRRSKA